MPLSRRGVLLGSAGVVAATATTSFFAFRGVVGGLLSAAEATSALRDLAKQSGRDAFRLVSLDNTRKISAAVLDADGVVLEYVYDDGTWNKDFARMKTSAPAATAAQLPLDRLDDFAAVVPGVESIDLEVDQVGRVTAAAFAAGKMYGLRLDGSGVVPELVSTSVAGVRAAVAEIVAGYGRGAAAIGSYGGGTYVDANVEGGSGGVHITRGRRTAASAAAGRETPYEAGRLFDPTGFDPTAALARAARIATDTEVEGKVLGWVYERPPQGGEPLISFRIGVDRPKTRVWLEPDGNIATIAPEPCPAATSKGPTC